MKKKYVTLCLHVFYPAPKSRSPAFCNSLIDRFRPEGELCHSEKKKNNNVVCEIKPRIRDLRIRRGQMNFSIVFVFVI